jgi:hypothetical protein
MPDSNFPLLPSKINMEIRKKQDMFPKIHTLQQIPNIHSRRKRKPPMFPAKKKEPPQPQITSLKPKARDPIDPYTQIKQLKSRRQKSRIALQDSPYSS